MSSSRPSNKARTRPTNKYRLDYTDAKHTGRNLCQEIVRKRGTAKSCGRHATLRQQVKAPVT